MLDLLWFRMLVFRGLAEPSHEGGEMGEGKGFSSTGLEPATFCLVFPFFTTSSILPPNAEHLHALHQ